jgi:hypothetical protein
MRRETKKCILLLLAILLLCLLAWRLTHVRGNDGF